MLLQICVSRTLDLEARIAAPNLADVDLRDDMGRYEIAEAGRHLQRLVVNLRFPVPAILRRFDTIGELIVRLLIQSGREGYNTFIKEVRGLDCETLVLRSMWTVHQFEPSMLHLLRICNGLKKFVVTLRCSELIFACTSDCPRTWPESYRNDNISLDSLEELEINGFTGKDHQLDSVNLLVGRNAPLLKGVVFRLPPRDFLKCSNIIRDKIRGMLPPGLELWACLENRKSFGILDELNLYA
ncbi:hypothetical protein PAHAL_2G404300 [Panicum hallii]|uniref:FBD domain-containing protein n=1 Tax=Panicum hallii TaxID=206008 RepID=A0A2T8KSB7_9POAL|nr:hypothetical protein PAHAL_2G404300 [Panicum hallii]